MGREYNFEQLPSSVASSMREYVLRGVPPGEGSFLEALLCNNLEELYKRSDDKNCWTLFDTVNWCHDNLPAQAWGSAEKAAAWCVFIQEYITRASLSAEGESRVDSPGLRNWEDQDYD